MTLGERIRTARERLRPKLTQKKLGEILGVSFQAVSQWERGEDRPDVGKIPQLRMALRVNFAWLLSGDGDPPAPDSPEVIMDDVATTAPPEVKASIAKAILGLRKRSAP